MQWEQAVSVPDSIYCWFGRPAVRADSQDRGRGSGGIGLLIRREWFDFCVEMPACEHPCLHFVRVELPDAPFPIYFGVAYAVPVGSARESINKELLNELGELSAQYQRLGMVIVAGDFNTHIVCIPFPLVSLPGAEHEPASDDEDEAPAQVTLLERNSIDIAQGALADEVPAAGAAFMDQLDSAGLVGLNGLCAVGDTFGARDSDGSASVAVPESTVTVTNDSDGSALVAVPESTVTNDNDGSALGAVPSWQPSRGHLRCTERDRSHAGECRALEEHGQRASAARCSSTCVNSATHCRRCGGTTRCSRRRMARDCIDGD